MMSKNKLRTKKKREVKEIVNRRINSLLFLANSFHKKGFSGFARFYFLLAFSLVKRYKIRLGERKWLFCRKCFCPWGKENIKHLEGKEFFVCSCGYRRKVPIKGIKVLEGKEILEYRI